MSEILRKQAPISIIFVTTIIVFVNFFEQGNLLFKSATDTLTNMAVIMTGFAFFLVAINLFITYGRVIAKKTKGEWIYAIYALSLFTIYAGLGFLPGYPIGQHPYFLLLYNQAQYHISRSMMAILAFSMVGAAIRAFRMRTFEASLLLLGAVFVWLNTAPIGAVINPNIPVIGQFFLDVPSTAGNRGLLMCVAIGTIAVGIRQMVGLERGHLGIVEG